MPELPEAETTARMVRAALVARTVTAVRLRRRELLHGDRRPLSTTLGGCQLVDVTRRAKRVVLHFEPARLLVVRLGMTGRLLVCPPAEPRDRHVHLRMGFAGLDRELRFRDVRRFGDLWCLTERAGLAELDETSGSPAGDASPRHRSTSPSLPGHPLLGLGPEPLELTLAGFVPLLQRARPLKSLLLDQSIIAGLGNIYVDESLHAAGLHPLTPGCEVDRPQAQRLLRAIQRILRRAINHGGTTFMDYRAPNGEAGTFLRRLHVYQRAGQPCHGCGTTLTLIRVLGRATVFCPRCQPG